MIAQDVEEVLEGKDFGGFVDPNYALDDDDEGKVNFMSLRYEEFISPMIKAIQEVDKIEDREVQKIQCGRVSKLESNTKLVTKILIKKSKRLRFSEEDIRCYK